MPIPSANGVVPHYSDEVAGMSGIRFEPPRNIREFQRPPQGTDSVPPPMVQTVQTVIRQDNETGLGIASDAVGALNPNPIRIDTERDRDVELPGAFPRIASPPPTPMRSSPTESVAPPSPVSPPQIVAENREDVNRILENSYRRDTNEVVFNSRSPFVDRSNSINARNRENRVNPLPARRPKRLVQMTPSQSNNVPVPVVVVPGVEVVVPPAPSSSESQELQVPFQLVACK
ncbi:hypothetical protein DFS34DRAFT_600547 [Phlyctochytrium arcticum]|nr:hypothetical protein DFS34DRAFT_600547 [Phlyctochytrium arcticum]